MDKYLIEVPHGEEKSACLMAVKIFLSSGSHFLVNAEWGCKDGEHKAWMVVEADSKEEAYSIIPASLKPGSKVTRLIRFTPAELEGTAFELHR
jgi:hypothetical protein